MATQEEITAAIERFITVEDLPTLLVTIGQLCQEKYKRDSFQQYQSMRDDERYDPNDQERKEMDIASAFLSVNVEYFAGLFREYIATAGMTHEERHARDRAKKIKQLEDQLAREKELQARKDY